MSGNLAQNTYVSAEEYLAGEALADEKHEYVNGMIYALHEPRNMAGAGDAHVKVSLNTAALLKTHLRGSGCSTYMSDMRVKVDAKDKAWFYPDVMVSCSDDDRQHDTMKYQPVLVIEVLSPGTRDYDRGDKFAIYRQLTSLREYVLIDPEQYYIELFRLNKHRRWELFIFEGADAVVEFKSVGFSCSMADVYDEVLA
ncbi:MAG: Uma2 family endonuclease [Thiolinea sp.]